MKIITSLSSILLLTQCSPILDGALEDAIKRGNTPFRYNKTVGEYQVVYNNGDGIIPLYYDPYTGKKLKSRRGELFANPSRKEERDFENRAKKCVNRGDVIKQFGKPTNIFPRLDTRSGKLVVIKGEEYSYSSTYDTIEARITIDSKGLVVNNKSWGKQIKKSVESNQ